MGYQSTADKHLDKAREDIREAIRCLSEILINECEGHDDFRDDFVPKMHEAFDALMVARRALS